MKDKNNSKNGIGIPLLEGRQRKIYITIPDKNDPFYNFITIGWKTNDEKKPVLGAYMEFTKDEAIEIIKTLTLIK